jgi:tetratricopeptide (TPR) repeat protein
MANPTVVSHKDIAKDMKQPDAFQAVASKVAGWLVARKKQVLVAGAAIVALLVITAVGLAIQASRSASAGKAMGALLETVAAPVVAAPPAGFAGRTFPDETARFKAIVEEAAPVIGRYGGTDVGALAYQVRGDAHFGLKEWDAAAKDYQQFLGSVSKDDNLRFAALEGLALVAESKGDVPGALAAYERLAKEAPRFADRADLERARVLAASGKVPEAKELLTKFAANHKDSSLTSDATQRLAQLEAK